MTMLSQSPHIDYFLLPNIHLCHFWGSKLIDQWPAQHNSNVRSTA